MKNKTKQIMHGNGQMRAQSISLMVSSRIRCNGQCKFCISRTTPGICKSPESGIVTCDEQRLHVGMSYAHMLGASHVILTGKADPTQEDSGYLVNTLRVARLYVPLADMHTNAYLMLPGNQKEGLLEQLVKAGLTMITLSITSFDENQNRQLMGLKRSGAELIKFANEMGLMVRCSLVVNKCGVSNFKEVMEYIRAVGELGAHAVVVREIWRPGFYEKANPVVADWNSRNWVDITKIQNQFRKTAGNRNKFGLSELDPLPWGTPVFAVDGIFGSSEHGVNVTFARCDEATRGLVLKSIVHKPDGHGFRNWGTNGDILY